MAGLHLPEELLQLIIDHCGIESEDNDQDYKESWRTLASLCRVNKQCCRLTQPLLYQTIKVTSPKSSKLLARTVVSSSELANLVHDFDIEAAQLEDSSEVPLPDLDSRPFKAALKPLGNYRGHDLDERKILSNIQKGSVEAHLTATLTACVNIRRLSIEPHYRWKSSHVGRLLLVASVLNPQSYAPGHDAPFYPLPMLKDLSVKHWDTEGATALSEDHIRQLFVKRNLESFTGNMVELQEEEQVEVWGRLKSNIKTAKFQNSLMDHLGLAAFLHSCPKMESLHFDYGSSVVGDCDVQLQELGSALRQHGKSLRRLHFDPTEAYQFDEESFQRLHRPFGDLRPLSNLEELAVPAVCLLGEDDPEANGYPHFTKVANMAEVLPQSLRKLELLKFDRQDTDELLVQLELLIINERLELLQLIAIHVDEDDVSNLVAGLKEGIDRTGTAWSIDAVNAAVSREIVVLNRSL